jgi:hypothetical protein
VPTWANGSYFLGGKHFVYVHSSKYDACEAAQTALTTNVNTKRQFFQEMMWVSVPLLNEGYELLSSDVFVNIDVSREYREMNDVDETENSDNITLTTSATQLKDYLSNYDQLYAYEITSISASDSVKVTEESQLDSVMDLINVVPNPYYAYSTYEGVENGGQLDSRVRLTNLPAQCVISIYSLDGSLVKKLNKDSEGSATIDWDLKNQKGIPISSGAYIINVSVPSLGKEKNLKWFGVLRPIDLDTF